MNAEKRLRYLQKEIHFTVFAAVSGDGTIATCAIDIILADRDSLYFLTARGKAFYHRAPRRVRHWLSQHGSHGPAKAVTVGGQGAGTKAGTFVGDL